MKRTTFKKISLLPLVISLCFCGSPALFPTETELLSPSLSETTPPTPSAPVTLESIEFQTRALTLEPGQVAKPQILARLNNGSIYKNISEFLITPYKKVNFKTVWFSNNDKIASVDASGIITAKSSGSTTIKVSIGKLAQTIEIIVRETPPAEIPTPQQDPQVVAPPSAETNEETTPPETTPENNTPAENQNITEENTNTAEIYETEPPDDPAELFLNTNDIVTLNVGEHGGYNSQNLPDVVLGIPDASRADVVSLGTDGEILIGLNGYLIVDGPGQDFIVFENPFSGWTERAQVSVSDDGETFFDFDCNAFDPQRVYAGCAGVSEVNYSDDPEIYLDPETAGGDSFDLADAGLSLVRFIKITDMATCTSPALCNFGKAGFDLDAVAIVNGINE